MSDPLGALARDFDDVAEHLGDVAEPRRETVALLAGEVKRQVPVRTGVLAGSVTSGADAVEVTAVYAGVIHNGWAAHGIEPNPYADRAVSAVDVEPVWVEFVEEALDELRRFYV